jgi:hypothetical protein
MRLLPLSCNRVCSFRSACPQAPHHERRASGIPASLALQARDKASRSALIWPCIEELRVLFVVYAQFTLHAARLDVKNFSGATTSDRAKRMWIMVVYLLIVVISEIVVVAIGLVLDRIYPLLSLPVSLSLFFAVFWFGWIVAVRLTEPKHAKSAKHAN